MSTDRDVTRIVRSWLRTDEHESADRVLDAVLEALDTTPQRRATWWSAWRHSDMNTFAKIGVAAAVVTVAALLGFNYLIAPNIGGPQSSAEPTSTPVAYVWPGRPDPLDPGTYSNSFDTGLPFDVVFTVPAGWYHRGSELTDTGFGQEAETKGAIGVWQIDGLRGDPCTPGRETDSAIGPSVTSAIEGLRSIPGLDASTPVPTSLGGYAGQYVETTVRDNIPCPPAELGEHARHWVIDVDGDVLVISATSYPGASTADLAELQSIVSSIRFTPRD
jgi:hypothetical protein